MPFFKSSPKGPQELVKALKDAMQILCSEEGGKKSDKVRASCLDGVRSIQFASPVVYRHARQGEPVRISIPFG